MDHPASVPEQPHYYTCFDALGCAVAPFAFCAIVWSGWRLGGILGAVLGLLIGIPLAWAAGRLAMFCALVTGALVSQLVSDEESPGVGDGHAKPKGDGGEDRGWS